MDCLIPFTLISRQIQSNSTRLSSCSTSD